MFIVVTGLDGSGTSTIAEELHKLDEKSLLFKTPSIEYKDRYIIDDLVRKDSKVAHMLYYLSSTVYISDYIKNHCDTESQNVYVVRYLIDTVVSNRVAGIDMDLNYEIFGNKLLEPDLTLFVYTDEEIREERISKRGKSDLDRVLDDINKRKEFLEQYKKLLTEETIYIDNSDTNLNNTITKTYENIQKTGSKHITRVRGRL